MKSVAHYVLLDSDIIKPVYRFFDVMIIFEVEFLQGSGFEPESVHDSYIKSSPQDRGSKYVVADAFTDEQFPEPVAEALSE
jgi:hypothetical protein